MLKERQDKKMGRVQWAIGPHLYRAPSSCVLLTQVVLHLPLLPMATQKTENLYWKESKAFWMLNIDKKLRTRTVKPNYLG